MLSFLFLLYLYDNYETAAKKELGSDYPALSGHPSSILSVLVTLDSQDPSTGKTRYLNSNILSASTCLEA